MSSPVADDAAAGARSARLPADLTIVIPTFNERENVARLVDQLDRALAGIAWEAIFVDDHSPDGTAATVRELGRRDPRVRGLLRYGRRGLAGACIEGMLASSAPYLAVMDADLQHDATVLPRMLAALRSGSADLAIGSRFVEGGSVGDFAARRRLASKVSTLLAQRVMAANVVDPMSGFFMIRQESLPATWRRSSPPKASRSCSTSS